jgi:hypothetical protein
MDARQGVLRASVSQWFEEQVAGSDGHLDVEVALSAGVVELEWT